MDYIIESLLLEVLLPQGSHIVDDMIKNILLEVLIPRNE